MHAHCGYGGWVEATEVSMSADHSGRTCTHVHRTLSRALLFGALLSLLSLLSLAWAIGALLGQPPATAYASGVPYLIGLV
jgi:hypothetical protein